MQTTPCTQCNTDQYLNPVCLIWGPVHKPLILKIIFLSTGGLSESRQSTVTLQELDERAVETIVEFFYSGEIEISENNVQDLLPVTCILQVQSVQEACCEFLKRQLSSENCLGKF